MPLLGIHFHLSKNGIETINQQLIIIGNTQAIPRMNNTKLGKTLIANLVSILGFAKV